MADLTYGNVGKCQHFLWYMQLMFVCLQVTPCHYHLYADLSEGIELLNCLWGIRCRVCVKGSDNSLNYLLFNIWGCVSSAYLILLWWLQECVLYFVTIIKSEVWIINHCLGLGHEIIVGAVCLTVLLRSWCVALLAHTPNTYSFRQRTYIKKSSMNITCSPSAQFHCLEMIDAIWQ